MSSVSGITNGLTESLQSLWQAARQGKTDEVTGFGPTPPNGGKGPQQLWEDVEGSATASGLSTDEIDSLKTDLKAAISEAMETARQSENREAGRETVDDAILSTLQEYGVDTAEIEEHMAEAKAHMTSGPPPGHGSGGTNGDIASEILSSLSGSSDTQDTTSLLLSSLSSASGFQDSASTVLASLFPLLDEEA